MTTAAAASYSASGTLAVVASGYWFTAGGEKGSFGYYPHLKNAGQQPVYPDTQLHGDLKMVVGWLLSFATTSRAVPLASLFGSGGGDEKETPQVSRPSRVFIGDLQLADPGAWEKGRFHVKPRIQINDETRTVDRHFLVDLEMAWLDKLILEAPLHIGPFKTKQELEGAIKLLEDAATLLSGFGAFRSRGYGRGAVSIDLSDDTAITELPVLGKSPQLIALTARANLRNKPVDPGNAQTLVTDYAITPEQFKGWLVKAYWETYGKWPAPAQMAGIVLSPLYPAPDAVSRALPPAMSTLINEKEAVQDVLGEKLEQVEESMGYATENFFASKTKPLGRGWSVTTDKRAFKTATGRRFRNNIDDATFTTTEAGLFSQEYLPAGTIFTGTIAYSGTDADFNGQVSHLLSTRKPVIKGAPLTVSIASLAADTSEESARLVVAPFSFTPAVRAEDLSQVTIGTVRSYNATLKRPRRPSVMVLPGSIVTKDRAAAVPWSGFRSPIDIIQSSEKGVTNDPPTTPEAPVPLSEDEKKLTRAQAGLLRQMLHPAMSSAALKAILEHRIDKYEKKGNDEAKVLLPLLGKILAHLTERGSGHAAMKLYVRNFLDQYAIAQWEINSKKGGTGHDCKE